MQYFECVKYNPQPESPLLPGTELIYVILSLTAKLYLGVFLLVNVISVDGTVEQNFAGAGEAQ